MNTNKRTPVVFRQNREARIPQSILKGFDIPCFSQDGHLRYHLESIPRHDPRLVQVVRDAWGRDAEWAMDFGILEVMGDQYMIIYTQDGREGVLTPLTVSWTRIDCP